MRVDNPMNHQDQAHAEPNDWTHTFHNENTNIIISRRQILGGRSEGHAAPEQMLSANKF